MEGPDTFPDLHDSLSVALRVALQSRLPPAYFAMLNERTWIELSNRSIAPDVSVVRMERGTGRGRIAETATLPYRAVVVPLAEEEQRQPFLELFTGRGSDRRLVTGIEILSPSNKSPGGEGFRLYHQKQQELLNREVNLVEIDLLRAGDHITAVPRRIAEEKAGPFDYHVCVRYADRQCEAVVYPVKLRDSLPEIAIPLLPADGAVVVDLQVIFTEVYDAGPYRVAVDYSGAVPPPPLSPDDAEWARYRLAETAATKGA